MGAPGSPSAWREGVGGYLNSSPPSQRDFNFPIAVGIGPVSGLTQSAIVLEQP